MMTNQMNTKDLSLYHQIRPPVLNLKRPAALFLFHGYGSDEADLFSFAAELPGEYFIISVRAPFALEPFGYCWYTINFGASFGKWSDIEQAGKSRDMILDFIDEAIEAYELDPAQVDLLGFSQGTVLSYAVALSYPEKIRNVVALSGYIDENLLLPDYKNKEHDQLHFYCSHGQVDQVIPPAWAQRIPGFLENLDIDFIYEEFPSGHGVSPQNFYSFAKWLEEHT